MHVKTVFGLIVPALTFIDGVVGLPPRQYFECETGCRDHDLTSNHTGLTIRQNGKPALRILPLGASIVSGVGSSTGNGQVMDQENSLGDES
jgi:hypothetical protein